MKGVLNTISFLFEEILDLFQKNISSPSTSISTDPAMIIKTFTYSNIVQMNLMLMDAIGLLRYILYTKLLNVLNHVTVGSYQ